MRRFGQILREPGANDKPRSLRLHELFDHLELDESIQGYLDWVTGAMQVKCSIDEYLRNQHDVPPRYAETLFHEAFHAMQLSILGYLSRFAITLYLLIDESIEKKPIVNADEFFDLIPSTISQSSVYQNIIRDLHRKHSGVSVIDLVEGATVCALTRSEFDYETEAYLKHANESHLPDEYFRAFRCFVELAGMDCEPVKVFPMIAHLSLCSHSPPETFVNLAEAYRAQRLTLETNLPEIIEYCRATDKDYRGFSWEFHDANGSLFPPHPHFGKVLDAIANREDGSELLTYFLLMPEKIGAKVILDSAIDIVMFSPHPDPIDPRFREWPVALYKKRNESAEDKMLRVSKIKLHMAISRKLMGTVSIPLPSTE